MGVIKNQRLNIYQSLHLILCKVFKVDIKNTQFVLVTLFPPNAKCFNLKEFFYKLLLHNI